MARFLKRPLALVAALLALVSITLTVTLNDDGFEGSVKLGQKSPAEGGPFIVKQPGHDAISPPSNLPITPKAGELDGKEPDSTALAKTDIPGADEATEREIAKDNAETIKAQGVDVSRVLQGAAAEPARFTCFTAMNGGPRAISGIGLAVVHVTVSRNAPGYADGRAICDLFQHVKASSTWIVDNEGNSWENVPLSRVPWTQAWYNRVSCSIEFVGSTGRPGEGAAQWTEIQLREGARLHARCMKAAKIPVRWGAVHDDGNLTGHIILTGLISHQELGAPGGGHTDPGPYFPRAHYADLVKSFLKPKLTPLQKAQRSHRIVHAKIRKRCRSRNPDRPKGCRPLSRRQLTLLYKRNGQLHAKYGHALG